MKKSILAGVCITLLATGCQAVGQNDSPATQRYQNHTTYNPAGGTASILQVERADETDERRAQFGYVRHQSAQLGQHREPEAAYFDRTLLADTITKMGVFLPGVEEMGTLVTDKYAIIVYEESQNNNADNLEEQVYLTAASILPRFYDVYVTNNPEMFENIERFGTLSSRTPNVDRFLEATIRELESGDGGRMNEPIPENSPQPRT
ncbi:YhcN/YlaJ family sporulation lipoprotein [Alkalihalobacillus sp. LMS39]|uniref:YhcN/YlaJ family sporulation lipoprotein n=1 Tax=Alkalihalobacillus sp. LMS39 TaxID=2924032 RepID=UPI001FB1E419|nr:YhcN/YlaJ family sporulation lipoprotein [Alkalihalobacillus sp. LMS39]UOE93668.1 YhcN/YlaJ family sporulation lipoprotein [Alkalihalobacillus sp. LMS39]